MSWAWEAEANLWYRLEWEDKAQDTDAVEVEKDRTKR
jgi:hypothetical protein